MSKIRGRFYFKRTQHGNLLGEFSHSGVKINTIEAANLNGKSEGFAGNYDTVWLDGTQANVATLSIKPKTDTVGIFSLEWTENSKPIFTGEAMIVDDILIGDYQSV